MEPWLNMHNVSSVAEVDELFEQVSPLGSQVRLDPETPLVAAVALNGRMRAGIKGLDAFQMFNPEMVIRKIEAEEAMREAVTRFDASIDRASHKIQKTREKIQAVQDLLALGANHIYVGPSTHHRAVDREQVVFPALIPEGGGIGPERIMSKTLKRASRKDDAKSQIAFWQLNLAVLQAKEAAQVQCSVPSTSTR